MGLFDIFKKKKEEKGLTIASYLDGYFPSYSQFGTNVYASDVVQQGIYAIVSELKKLDPTHVRKISNTEYTPIEGNIQHVLNNPNPLMTTSDFLEKIIWNLMLNYNSFIYPVWEDNNLIGLYPLQPKFVDFLQDQYKNMWVKLRFGNGEAWEIPYENLIHIRYKYSMSEYLGGDVNGNPDNGPLLETLKINDTLIKGLAKSLEIQTSINGVIKYKTMANNDDLMKRVKDFEDKLKTNKSGLLPLDISSEYVPINKQVALLDNTVLEFIDRKILRTFGVSTAIINGDYTKAQYEAFFQKTLEPIIRSLNQAFTKTIFSKREQGFNNKIVFYHEELLFMTKQEQIETAKLLADTEAGFKNELRVILGLKPDKAFDNQIASSSQKTIAETNKGGNGGTNNKGASDNSTNNNGGDSDE